MNRKCIYSALLAGVSVVLMAQDPSIDRNVTVEREYQPVIEDAGKITTLPEILEPSATRLRVDYGDVFQPLPLGRFLQSLPMTAYQAEQGRRQEAFIRLGLGNYWNTMGELTLPVIKKEKDRLDVNIEHRGTFGRRKFSETQGSIDYNHLFKTTELFASVGGNHRFFNYFGSHFSPSGNRLPADTLTGVVADDSHMAYNGTIGFRTISDRSRFRHKGELKYDALSTNSGWKENIVNARYGFSTPYKKDRYGIDFDLQNLTYEAPALSSYVHPDYSVLTLNPYYLIEREKASVRLGLSSTFSFVTGRAFNPSPDIHGEWKVFPKFLAVYGGVGGDFVTVTSARLFNENPWVRPSLRVKDTYTPFKPYLGVKLKPAHFLLLDGFVEYNSIKDQYFFVNDPAMVTRQTGATFPILANWFGVEYSDASLVRFGGRLAFQYKNQISSSVKLVANKWTTESIAQAWMKPALEADWNIDVKVNPNLTISSNFYYEGERFARLGSQVVEMNPVADLNLSASYFFNRTFSSFVKLNNILNSNYEQFLGYDVQGFNFMLGGAISF